MCICCASSSDDAFEKLHEVESRAAKIKPHLDLAVGVWPCGRVAVWCGRVASVLHKLKFQ